MKIIKEFIDDETTRDLILLALIPLGLCALAYFIRFGICLDLPISPKTGDWGTFGDFLGGVLNPIYAYLAFVGVIYTISLQKRQQKLEELQQLTLGVAETIDNNLFQQKHKYKSYESNLITLLRSISDDSIRLELNPDLPISSAFSGIKLDVIDMISFDLAYLNEQLSHIIWCIENYEKNHGSEHVRDFYIGKYRNLAFMMKQVGHLHLQEVNDFFKVDDVKKMVISAIESSKNNDPL